MISLRCRDELCRLPWGSVINGALLVESRHGGEKHLNAISLHILYKLLLISRTQRDGADLVGSVFVFESIRPALVRLPVYQEPVPGLELLCVHCQRPWAYAINGRLMVESAHGGETHINQLEDKTIKAVFGTKYAIEGGSHDAVAAKGA